MSGTRWTEAQLNDHLARDARRRAPWADNDVGMLTLHYKTQPSDFDLEIIAKQLGRTPMAVALKASELGLTDSHRGKSDKAVEHMSDAQAVRAESKAERLRRSEATKQWLARNDHPRGFAGHKRTASEKNKIGLAAEAMWADPKHKVNSVAHRQAISDRPSATRAATPAANAFSRAKSGERQDLPGIHFRSAWEANYARYLNWLMQCGEIEKWSYESVTFWFEKIKRGCRSWKPDFVVTTTKAKAEEYHEVKGWMYPRAKTALRRMAKYHPEIKVVLIDEKRYKAIAKVAKRIIPHWE